MGFPGGSEGKESAYNAGDLNSIPESGRSPGEGNGWPLQFSCLEGYSSWGCKESDTSEQMTMSMRALYSTENSTQCSAMAYMGKSLKKGGCVMAAHSSFLAWRSPGTAEPGGLPSMESHRIGHDWSDLAAAAAARLCITETNTTLWISYTPITSFKKEL